MSEQKKNDAEIGALWISDRRDGMMTGSINGEKVVCFKNDRKTGKQPDWRVLRSVPKPDRGPVLDTDAPDW